MFNKKTSIKKFNEVVAYLKNIAYDDDITINEKYANQLGQIQEQFVARNKWLSKLLSNFILQQEQRSKHNKIMKVVMFVIFNVLLLSLTTTVVIVFVTTDFASVNVSSVVSLFSVGATYFGSVLSILKIMSIYLFPVEEEKNTIDMVKTVIDNDIEIEGVVSKTVDKVKYIYAEELKVYKELLKENVITEDDYNDIKEKLLIKITSDLSVNKSR